MEKIIAYCGLHCHSCPILRATREKDPDKQRRMRAQVARQIEKHYGIKLTPEEITDCDGCTTKGGRIYADCKKCKIRACAIQQGVANCAFCDQYPCKELEAFLAKEPTAKKHMEQLRSNLKRNNNK